MAGIARLLNINTRTEKTRATLCASIKLRRVIEFYYHEDYRTVEPFALGIVKYGNADNESLLCYQTGGHSESTASVGWKLYRASEIEDPAMSNEQFTGDRPGYDPENINMDKIICCIRPQGQAANIAKEKAKQPKAELRPEIQPAPKMEPLPVYTVERLTPVFLDHNELMTRFRFAHPIPIRELYTKLWLKPLVRPFSEGVERKNNYSKRIFNQFPTNQSSGLGFTAQTG
jgi:hypothetical protein